MEKTATVLYIEDNADNRLLVRRILEAYGFGFLGARDAQQALEVLDSQTPDLILMDINMPDIDGYVLTSQLKSLPHMSGVPIIAMTANVMKGDRERSLAAGCDGYIQKPIDVDILPTQLRRFIEQSK
jgi:two-component system cell cycle response regulator DivK